MTSEYVDGIRRIEKQNSARVIQFSLDKLENFQNSLDQSVANLDKLRDNKIEIETALAKINTMISDEQAAQTVLVDQIAEVNVAIANASHQLSGVAPVGHVSAAQFQKATSENYRAGYDAGMGGERERVRQEAKADDRHTGSDDEDNTDLISELTTMIKDAERPVSFPSITIPDEDEQASQG